MELCRNTIWEPKPPGMECVPALLPVPSASHEPSGAHVPLTAAPQKEVNRNSQRPGLASLRVLLPDELEKQTKKISGERNTVAVIYLYFSTKFDTVFHKTLLKNIIQTRQARSPVLCGGLGWVPPGHHQRRWEAREAPVSVLSCGGEPILQPVEPSLRPHGLAHKEGLWPEGVPKGSVPQTKQGVEQDPIHPKEPLNLSLLPVHSAR